MASTFTPRNQLLTEEGKEMYTALISIACIIMLVGGIYDLHKHPDLAQGLGVANYIMCLIGTLMGAWIALWAIVKVIREKG